MPLSYIHALLNDYLSGPCHAVKLQEISRPPHLSLSPRTRATAISVPANASDTDYPEQTNDAVARQHRAIAMEETVYVPGCTCAFCAMRSENDDDTEPTRTAPRLHSRSHALRSLPSIRSVMEVLYPPSDLGTPSPFPDPPSYSRSDSPTQGGDSEISPLMTTSIQVEGTPLSYSRPDPLAQIPSLTGVPSQRIPYSGAHPVEPSPPIIGLDDDVLEEPLPAYSRFDQRRPRFPVASDILGPYPPMSVIRRSAQ
ncbi:hypothetical protein HD554DRAFT_2311636 [Boletus coccyginus]|nr:hypothetical protein HD554DRAFT_2311636 [Boletus coccyginus]